MLVKRFRGAPGDAERRVRRSLAFERVMTGIRPASFTVPRCVGWDCDAGLIAFEFVEDARSGADLTLSDDFDDGLAHRVGLAVGELHAMPPGQPGTGAGTGASTEAGTDVHADPSLPSASLLQGLPVGIYAACSAAELQAWSLMQRDAELIAAIRRLLRWQRRAPRTPAHCDLRLEQLFVAAGQLYICDWEEFRIADPARDVGSFAGEWLHLAVMTSVAGDAEAAEEMSHAEIVRRISAGIERLRPRIAAFWAGYRAARPAADQDLAVRAAAFGGWHLFDRMLAISRRTSRLRAIDRAAAGIGRTILLSPGDLAGTVGLEA